MKKLSKKQKNVIKMFSLVILMLGIAIFTTPTVFAEETDPIKVVNNLSDFIFKLVKGIGYIILIFSIVQIGLSIKSHDPSQRANGFLTFAGGIVITFAKDILDLITK